MDGAVGAAGTRPDASNAVVEPGLVGGTVVPVPPELTTFSPKAEDEDEEVLRAAFACVAARAAEIEKQAMELDRAGDAQRAIERYREAAEQLVQATTACPEDYTDKVTLARHTGEVMGRVVYLQSLAGGPATAPIEEHIGHVTLTLGPPPSEPEEDSMPLGSVATDAAKRPSRVKQALSAAAIGGAAGLLVVHGPITAAALAVGAAYATTRNDTSGEAAREVGNAGIAAVRRARKFNQEHKVTSNVSEKVEEALVKARAMDEKYGLIDKTQAMASSSWETLSEVDRNHHVSMKLGRGLTTATASVASATSKVASWVAKRTSAKQQPQQP
mmetsp:Transcript_102004/g.287974  ORF Transcript_102004/g.287974 Transcript_102004/m.287974 type:complete len:329 (-) Transcript_102004:76-1062(-)